MNKLRPRKKMQIGGDYEEDNKFNSAPAYLRPQPSYGFVGPMQPTTPNYGPMGPFNYDNSPGLKNDCPENMIWDESLQTCTYDNGYDPAQEQEKNKPKGRGIEGMLPMKTGPGTGVNPQDPVKKEKKYIDPYFSLRGATTGLSWLAGVVARNRQNQYARDEFSTLGQIGAKNVNDFQPNRYNLYAQKGGKLPPITVDNPNDPRLRAYNDSLLLNNYSNNVNNKLTSVYGKQNLIPYGDWESIINNVAEPKKIKDAVKRLNNPKPIKEVPYRVYTDTDEYPAKVKLFAKPVQPVVYQKPEGKPQSKSLPPIYTDDKNDPRLKAYSDSSLLSSKDAWDTEKINKNMTQKQMQDVYFDKYKKLDNKNYQKVVQAFGDTAYMNGKNPDLVSFENEGRTKIGFKFPKQKVIYREQKDYPIVERPGAQVRGTITPGQMTRDTTQDGVPIYGPANSTIGYWNNGTFSPYTGVNQRGTVNNPDTELMQNSEALKKYLRGKGLNFKKGGLTPNKARQILHDKKVHGKPLTDKQRRLFGAMSEGHTLKY